VVWAQAARPNYPPAQHVQMKCNTRAATIDIASFYWSLTGGDAALDGQVSAQCRRVAPRRDSRPSMVEQLGQDVFDALSDAAGRGVALRIVQSQPTGSMPDDDSAALAKRYPNTVSLRSINMTNVLGGGIVHTKFWVVDGSSIFVGSANMDWRCPHPSCPPQNTSNLNRRY
jgi:phospholipase D3/4